jgi:hypothetical protein
LEQEQVMKRHRDSIAAVLGLVLGMAAMAGSVGTVEYAHAAGAEARGWQALFDGTSNGQCRLAAVPPGAAPVLLAANEVAE